MRTNLAYVRITGEIRRVRDSIGTVEKYYTCIFNKKIPKKPRIIHIVNIFNMLNLKDDVKVFTSAKLLLTPSKPKNFLSYQKNQTHIIVHITRVVMMTYIMNVQKI